MGEYLPIKRLIDIFLRDSPAAHKRRCAIRQGVVETDPASCTHAGWNVAKQWCEDCGITAEERLFDKSGPR